MTKTRLSGALLLLLALVPLLAASQAQASIGDVARIAHIELSKNVSENSGNNLPRYNRGRGALAPYSIAGAPWDMSFISHVMQRAGYTGHLRGTATMTSADGRRVVAYTGALTAAARRDGKIRSAPRVGYLAFYGDRHVEIVTAVNKGQVIATIGGNVRDSVARAFLPTGITHFVAPW